jgi:hypothetical protein
VKSWFVSRKGMGGTAVQHGVESPRLQDRLCFVVGSRASAKGFQVICQNGTSHARGSLETLGATPQAHTLCLALIAFIFPESKPGTACVGYYL